MYRLTNSNLVIRGDGAGIPFDLGNKDYQFYLEWLAEGNTPDPVESRVEALQTLALADAPFTPRRMREFMRLVLEDKGESVAEKLGVPVDVVLAANPGYQLVKTYDDMAADARTRL